MTCAKAACVIVFAAAKPREPKCSTCDLEAGSAEHLCAFLKQQSVDFGSPVGSVQLCVAKGKRGS